MHSRAGNSQVTDSIRPEFKLVRDFMPVLVVKDPIKNECASLEAPFSNETLWKFLDAQGHLTPKGVVRFGRNSNLYEILCMSSLPASLTKIGSKLKVLAWRLIELIYDGVEAEIRKSQSSFQIIQVSCEALPSMRLWIIWKRAWDFLVEASTPSLIIFLIYYPFHFYSK